MFKSLKIFLLIIFLFQISYSKRLMVIDLFRIEPIETIKDRIDSLATLIHTPKASSIKLKEYRIQINTELIKYYIKLNCDTLNVNNLLSHNIIQKIGDTTFNVDFPNQLLLQKSPYKLIEFGIGLPAVSINYKDRKFGFLESISPVQITFNFFQRVFYRKEEIENIAIWCLSFGFLISKPTDEKLSFGYTFTPYSIRINDFSFGIGIKYQDPEFFKPLDKNRYSLIFPISYQIWNKKD